MKIQIAYNQLTAFNGGAVGLGQGLSNLASAVIVNAGSGYTLGDVLTVAGGTNPLQKAQLVVTGVSGGTFPGKSTGSITAVAVGIPGIYSTGAKPANAASVTGGTGSNATFNLAWNDNAVPQNAVWAELTAEGGDVRYRSDGVAPTSTVGELLKQVAGTGNNSETQPLEIFEPLANVQVIGVVAGSILNVMFYGVRKMQNLPNFLQTNP